MRWPAAWQPPSGESDVVGDGGLASRIWVVGRDSSGLASILWADGVSRGKEARRCRPHGRYGGRSASASLDAATGYWPELAGQWAAVTKDFSAPEKTAIVALGVVLLPIATWRPMVTNMFFGLAGRHWVNVVAAFVMGLPLVAAIPLGCWVFMHPEYHHALLAAVPCVLASAAGLKLLVGAWSLRALGRRRLIETRLLARLVGAWLLIAGCLIALFCWLLPGTLAPWYLVVSCVVLGTPLVRITWAPLALAWNRHR